MGWSIICISPGILNLITYIERSEWIDTQYIIDRRRPFAQCRRRQSRKKIFFSADNFVQAHRKETFQFEETARLCVSTEEKEKVSRKVVSFHNC